MTDSGVRVYVNYFVAECAFKARFVAFITAGSSRCAVTHASVFQLS